MMMDDMLLGWKRKYMKDCFLGTSSWHMDHSYNKMIMLCLMHILLRIQVVLIDVMLGSTSHNVPINKDDEDFLRDIL